MKDAGFFNGFLCGIVALFLIIMVVDAVVVTRVSDITQLNLSDSTYTVVIDDAKFVCDVKPTIKDNKIILHRCAELYGWRTIVQDYTSVELREN